MADVGRVIVKTRVAILGSRGIPGRYGGFESFAERLSSLLVDRGYEVTVYCCSGYTNEGEGDYRGIKRIFLPTLKKKSLEKIIFTLLSLIHVAFRKADIVLMLGVSAAPFCFIPRIFGKKVAINIDGLEWRRAKWGKWVSLYLKLAERFAGITCNEVITDSRVIQDYYYKSYGKKIHYIAYGAEIVDRFNGEGIKNYGLEKQKYILQVCRLEPENNPHFVIREFRKVRTDLKLIIVGDAPYSDGYIKSLKENGDKRIHFLGAVYGKDYKAIQSQAYCYIHGHEVGGTNPSLLEALGAGNCVLTLDVPYNLEVINQGEAGIPFSKREGDLCRKLQEIIDKPEVVAEYGRKGVQTIKENYTWGKIVSRYEEVFRMMSRSGESLQKSGTRNGIGL